MHTGKIKKLVIERGFGFITDSDGKEVFFHRSGLVDVQYDLLQEGTAVEFEIENSPKGPRAVSVKVTQ